MSSDLQSIISRDAACDENIRRYPNDPVKIREYREEKYRIAAEILRLYQQAENADADKEQLPLYKKGAAAACEAVRTRITETVHSACRITQPSVVSAEFRQQCVCIFDELTKAIKDLDAMYFPEHIERQPPTREFLITLQKQFDLEKQRAVRAKQSNNKELNRLFGSRG